jgi:hypothetical protein
VSPIDKAFALLQGAYVPPPYNCVGWRSDLWDVGQWIAYCTHCEPVPIDVFEGMQGEAAVKKRWMPAFEEEAVARAIHGMPDCEVKTSMCDWLKRKANK